MTFGDHHDYAEICIFRNSMEKEEVCIGLKAVLICQWELTINVDPLMS